MTGPDRAEGTAVLSDEERADLFRTLEEFRRGRFTTASTMSAVERILAARALTEVIARIEAVTPREALRPNERRAFWLGVHEAMYVIKGARAALAATPDGHQHAAEES